MDLAKELLIAQLGDKLMLPVDHVVAAELKEGAANEVRRRTFPTARWAWTSARRPSRLYSPRSPGAKTIIWNGPMGVFEKPPFDKGTVALAKAVAESGAVSVVGGGDSEKAIKSAGVTDKITHVSTGGGASLEFLSGIELPGVAALTNK